MTTSLILRWLMIQLLNIHDPYTKDGGWVRQGTSIALSLSFLCSYSHMISSLLILLFSESHYYLSHVIRLSLRVLGSDHFCTLTVTWSLPFLFSYLVNSITTWVMWSGFPWEFLGQVGRYTHSSQRRKAVNSVYIVNCLTPHTSTNI